MGERLYGRERRCGGLWDPELSSRNSGPQKGLKSSDPNLEERGRSMTWSSVKS